MSNNTPEEQVKGFIDLLADAHLAVFYLNCAEAKIKNHFRHNEWRVALHVHRCFRDGHSHWLSAEIFDDPASFRFTNFGTKDFMRVEDV